MKRQEPSPNRNNLLLIIFLLLQFLIIFLSFSSYESIIDGVHFYSEGVIIWACFFTCINCIILILLTKEYKNKFFCLSVFMLSLFSVLATSALIKEDFNYASILSIIFLLTGLFAFFQKEK